MLRGRGGRQVDALQVVLIRSFLPLRALLGRQVGGDEARAADGGEVLREALDTPPLDGVPVGHRGRGNPIRGQLVHRVEEILQVRAALKRRDGCALDGGAVHARVGVGKSQLDDVDAGVREDLTRANGVLDRRETDGQVGDQGCVAALERRIDGDGGMGGSAHVTSPRSRPGRPRPRGRRSGR